MRASFFLVSKIFSQVWSFFKEWEDNVCFASIDVFVAAVVVAVVVVVAVLVVVAVAVVVVVVAYRNKYLSSKNVCCSSLAALYVIK